MYGPCAVSGSSAGGTTMTRTEAEQAGFDRRARSEATVTPTDEDQAHHPLGRAVADARRSFTAAETREGLLDAVRPLAHYLDPIRECVNA